MEILNHSFAGNPVRTWALALVIFALTWLAIRVGRKIVIKRLQALSSKTETLLDDLALELLQQVKPLFVLAATIYAGSTVLKLHDKTQALLNRAMILVLLLQFAIWGTQVISFWIERYMKRRATEDASIATTVGLMSFLARLSLYGMLVLLALNNVGVDITALVAGLGVGGIAIALAVQNILGDLFASLTIVLDKPFVVGDVILVGEFIGSIEHIGLKTTRLRSLSGEQVVFSNNDLLQSRIRNFKRMEQRRVVFSLGVTYQTTHAKLQKIPAIIKAIIESKQGIRFDRCHFNAFKDFSLNFETVYWITTADYNIYMDIQQSILLDIHGQFEKEAIEFAYPTQTLFVQNQAPQPLRPPVDQATAAVHA